MTAVNCHFSEIFLLLSVSLPCAVHGEQVAFVEVIVREQADASGGVLQGDVLKGSLHNELSHNDNELQADLRLIQNEDEGVATASQDPWIGVVHAGASAGSHASQESFTAAVVRKMDLAEILSKPVVIIQTSENVTKLIGALLRGLHVTAKITYRTFLQNNVGATLTLWSSCGRSRGGLYSEWQGVVCTGETNSPVQKYLQQLWDTVVLAALILSTGVIVQARWQYQDNQFNDELEVNDHLLTALTLRVSVQYRDQPVEESYRVFIHSPPTLHSPVSCKKLLPKQDLLQRLSVLRTRTYKQPKAWSDTDSCAVCLEQYSNNQCLRVLPCLHEFHRDCVDPWLLLQQTCPLCKRSVLGLQSGSYASVPEAPGVTQRGSALRLLPWTTSTHLLQDGQSGTPSPCPCPSTVVGIQETHQNRLRKQNGRSSPAGRPLSALQMLPPARHFITTIGCDMLPVAMAELLPWWQKHLRTGPSLCSSSCQP
ncbi:hypothetical protein P4O66_012065 [Electrophorus voltai]|uniref:RING-type domain-containing protein n=1 Tax=Electrophorus voltai TaxID=2609070 RepID=A0AAD9DT31_9TELE|nr:hypothetical protein P4O66_012065 [Electrophorus voltai]